MNRKAIAAIVLASGVVLQACANQQEKTWTASDFTAVGIFTDGVEGPAVDSAGNLYAVNFARQGTIGIIDGDGRGQVFTDLPEGSTGNGIRFGQKGEMYIADYTAHNVLRIDTETRSIDVYAHHPEMNQPNDIAITKSGVIYASDPNWKDGTGQLWMVGKDRKPVRLEAGMGTTNGIEVSTDEKHLYVNESVQRKVWVYDIQSDGGVTNKRLFHEFSDHGMDGMRCDDEGNLYIARYGAGTVAVLSKQGELIREIELSGNYPTNVAFGGSDGKTVFVTMQKRGAIEAFRSDYAGRLFLDN